MPIPSLVCPICPYLVLSALSTILPYLPYPLIPSLICPHTAANQPEVRKKTHDLPYHTQSRAPSKQVQKNPLCIQTLHSFRPCFFNQPEYYAQVLFRVSSLRVASANIESILEKIFFAFLVVKNMT